MPTYTFRNKKTGETFTDIISIRERDLLLEQNPDLEQSVENYNFMIGDPIRLGIKKPDPAFRNLLKNMKKKNTSRHNESTINTF